MEFNYQFDSFGTRQVIPLPSDDELKKFYAENYFQENKGSYQKEYSADEVSYFHFYHQVFYEVYKENINKPPNTLLDVGCGEGFTANWFYKKGVNVSAVDFSDFAIKQFHPELIDKINFIKCDLINDNFLPNEQFDIIILKNVLEHVKDIDKLILSLKSKMHSNSLLVILIPNDTSNPFLDSYLEINNFDFKDIKTYAPPEHLRYFSFDSLNKFMLSKGYKEVCQIGDFPIEMFLLDKSTDYYQNSFGKTAHSIRCSVTNILAELDHKKVIRLLTSFADLNLGRSIIGFYRINK